MLHPVAALRVTRDQSAPAVVVASSSKLLDVPMVAQLLVFPKDSLVDLLARLLKFQLIAGTRSVDQSTHSETLIPSLGM